jgi:hypothetical protein
LTPEGCNMNSVRAPEASATHFKPRRGSIRIEAPGDRPDCGASSLAIFIARLGLFGLATYTTEVRTKEIGIRKVLGANVNQLKPAEVQH